MTDDPTVTWGDVQTMLRTAKDRLPERVRTIIATRYPEAQLTRRAGDPPPNADTAYLEALADATVTHHSIPDFRDYADFTTWADEQAKRYGGKRAFAASPLYRRALPSASGLHTRATRTATSTAHARAAEQAAQARREGVGVGDAVVTQRTGFALSRFITRGAVVSRKIPRTGVKALYVRVTDDGGAGGKRYQFWAPAWVRADPA